jgi:hypothetical protein
VLDVPIVMEREGEAASEPEYPPDYARLMPSPLSEEPGASHAWVHFKQAARDREAALQAIVAHDGLWTRPELGVGKGGSDHVDTARCDDRW